tara:strand:+ start:1267 stop:1422 length:156 start_codon:yes stop_codon:yes gene_type:complete
MKLTANEKAILLACLQYTQDSPVGFEALEGRVDVSEDEIYDGLQDLKNKLK